MLASVCLVVACSDQGLTDQAAPAPTGPDLRVDPGAVDLGTLPAGGQATAVVTVSNAGDAALHLDDVALVEARSGLALVTPTLPLTLAPGTSVQATLRFDAVVAELEAELRVRSDDPDSPEVTVPVSGGALLPLLVLDPDPYDFGVVTPGERGEGEVDLRNDGNVDLVVDTLLLLAEHVELTALPALPLTLAPGEAWPLPLAFAPLSRGDEAGQLWVGSNSWLGDTMGTVTGHGGWPGISGRVCDPSGDGWVIDAQVTADIDHDGDGEVDWVSEARTDADGRYLLQDVPPGTWLVHVQKGSYSAEFEATVADAGAVTELSEGVCLDPDSVRIAVVTAEWDSVEMLVADLGLDYDAYEGAQGLETLLEEGGAIDDYDVLFVNCGDYRALGHSLGALGPQLLRWVEAGGSLYVSDWAWQVVETSWPEMAEFYGHDTVFDSPAVGAAARLQAEVVDPVMAYAVGSTTAEIVYDLDAWMVIESAGASTEVLVQADVPTLSLTAALSDVPLAVRAEPGGRVIYTTFHNDRQLTEDMDAALREIILSL